MQDHATAIAKRNANLLLGDSVRSCIIAVLGSDNDTLNVHDRRKHAIAMPQCVVLMHVGRVSNNGKLATHRHQILLVRLWPRDACQQGMSMELAEHVLMKVKHR